MKQKKKNSPKTKITKTEGRGISTKIRKKAFLEAMKQRWTITAACIDAGISRDTFYRWLKEDPEFVKKLEDITHMHLDYAESKLAKKIKEEETASIHFFLRRHPLSKYRDSQPQPVGIQINILDKIEETRKRFQDDNFQDDN